MSSKQSDNVDRLKVDAYTDHLAAINDQRPVVACEDIVNQFGVLLVAKGASLSRRSVKVLGQHRLAKTIEQQVEVTGTLTDRQLYKRAMAFLESHSDYLKIHQENNFEGPFSYFFINYALPEMVRQKLTVMEERIPDEFEHSLFSAWGSALIAKEMKLSQERQYHAFVCGLCHDLGILHIDPELIDFSKGASDSKIRALQSHTVIGKILVDELDIWDPEIGLGVLEHHERLDQTGYPSRKAGSQLGLLGQIVAGADLIHHLSKRKIEAKEAALSSCLPHFKIHYEAFKPEVCSAVFRVLSKAKRGPSENREPLEQLQARVCGTHAALLELAEELPVLIEHQATIIERPGGKGVVKVAQAILNTLTRSGLGDEDLSGWLHDPVDPDDQGALVELEETDAMAFELLWLYKRLGWGIELVKEQSASEPALEKLIAYGNRLSETLSERWVHYS